MPVTEYLSLVVTPILSRPDSFSVIQTQDSMGVLLSMSVHKDDMGLIVGKHGDTANAIRHLVRIVGLMAKQRVSVRINEPEGSTYQHNS